MAQRLQLLDVPACGLFLLYVWLWPGVRILPEGVSDMVLRPLEAVAHVAALIPFKTFAATTVPFETGSNYHIRTTITVENYRHVGLGSIEIITSRLNTHRRESYIPLSLDAHRRTSKSELICSRKAMPTEASNSGFSANS